MEQLTLDMTAIRDATDPTRPRHGDASKLLALAESGEVELGVPPQGSLADLRGQFSGELAARLRALYGRPGVVRLPQVALLSDVTLPGENLIPGAHDANLHTAWNAIAASWNGPGHRPGNLDRWYVESHVLGGRDVLLTEDQGLRTMSDGLRGEHGICVRVESLPGYISRRT